MTAVSNFTNPIFGSIRVMNDNDLPLFVANDVCNSLGYSNPRDAISRHVDSEDVVKHDTLTSKGYQAMTYVNESGLYQLVFSSKLENAKTFKRWVTSEVLPAIRKTGGYMVSSQSDTNEDIMARALLIANDTIERIKNRSQQLESKTIELEAKIEADQPRVLFSKAVETSEKSILVGELARILKQNGIEIGQNRMFEHLRENHYLISRRGEMYNQPTQKGLDLGLFELKKTTITKPDGTVLVSNTTKITCKGQLYFVNKFLKQ